jgi:hypothetical protein
MFPFLQSKTRHPFRRRRIAAERRENHVDYRLTQHAQDVLQKRQIALAWVEKAFYQPEWTQDDAIDPDLEHRMARFPEFGDRLLRVIVNIKTVHQLL